MSQTRAIDRIMKELEPFSPQGRYRIMQFVQDQIQEHLLLHTTGQSLAVGQVVKHEPDADPFGRSGGA